MMMETTNITKVNDKYKHRYQLQCNGQQCKCTHATRSQTFFSIVTFARLSIIIPLLLPSFCSSFLISPKKIVLTQKHKSITTTAAGRTTTSIYARREKKNKYANFSKADKLTQDPFEALVSESEQKTRHLQVETLKKQNKPIPLDEKTQNALKQEKRDRNKMEFPDTRKIDPYDPTTYGFTELGTVLGAHGVHGLVKIAAVTEFPERLCKPGIRHIKAPNRRSPREITLLDGREIAGEEYLVKFENVGDRDAANKLRGCVIYAKQSERPTDIAEDEYLVSDLVGLDVYIEKDFIEENDEEEEEDLNYDEIDDEFLNYNDEEEEEMEEYIADDDEEEGSKEFSIIQDLNQSSSNKQTRTKALGGAFVGTVGGIVLAEEMCSIPGLGQDLLEVILPRGLSGTPSWRDEMVLIPMVPQIVPRVDLKGGAIYITPPRGLLDLSYVKEEKVRIRGFLPPAKD